MQSLFLKKAIVNQGIAHFLHLVIVLFLFTTIGFRVIEDAQ